MAKYSKGLPCGILYGKYLCQLDCDLFFSYCNNNYCVCFGPLTGPDVAAREQQAECCLATWGCCFCYPCYMAGKINANVWQDGKKLGPKEQAIKNGIFWENFCLAVLAAAPIDAERNPIAAAAQDALSAIFYYTMRKSVAEKAGDNYESWLGTCCYANCCLTANLAQLEAIQETECKKFDPNHCDDEVPLVQSMNRMKFSSLQKVHR